MTVVFDITMSVAPTQPTSRLAYLMQYGFARRADDPDDLDEKIDEMR